MMSIATSGRQRSVMSAPWNSTAWEKATKCGVGLIVCMAYCSQTGMLSIGVLLPESNCVTISTGMASRPNWPIVVASVSGRPPALPGWVRL